MMGQYEEAEVSREKAVTYTVQVEGVRLARRVRGHWEGDLDRRVGREGVDAAAGEEVRGGERAGHDL